MWKKQYGIFGATLLIKSTESNVEKWFSVLSRELEFGIRLISSQNPQQVHGVIVNKKPTCDVGKRWLGQLLIMLLVKSRGDGCFWSELYLRYDLISTSHTCTRNKHKHHVVPRDRENLKKKCQFVTTKKKKKTRPKLRRALPQASLVINILTAFGIAYALVETIRGTSYKMHKTFPWKPLACCSWFRLGFEHFMTSFLWSDCGTGRQKMQSGISPQAAMFYRG